jgi:Spy/CpxP family protein refolding chaperone
VIILLQISEDDGMLLQIELTEDERDTFKQMLQEELSELRAEIADTDRKNYRDMLKAKEVLLNRIIGGL